jgi:DNA-binding CsgD family transcriptional regulator
VIVDDVKIIKQRMNRAQKRVYEGVEVLRANRGQPHQMHSIIFCSRGAEICAAIRGYFVPLVGQALPDLFMVGLDSAVFGNHTAAADECDDREVVVNAFRSGARGLFCFSQYPFRLLCKCIHSVHQGQVWADSEQMQYVIESLSQVPSLHMVNSRGTRLLTPREEQVVALVADGLSNREVACELRLSEHTIKKYLFRIFDKLGISSRVELVLYALSHGGSRQAEWVAGANA